MKKILLSFICAIAFSGTANAGIVFVGSWHVGDGPQWSADLPDHQETYSGLDAAALIFGGDSNDYIVSTISDLVADINFSSWYDIYGAGGFAELSQDFSNGDYYSSGVRSAYILDHSCSNRYQDNNLTCPDSDPYINYAFINDDINSVPEPTSLALLGLGLAGVGFSRKKKMI